MSKLKIVFLQIVLLFLVSVNLQAQEGGKSTLKGYVVDESGAIPGVSLFIKGTHTGTVSGTDGSFIVSNIPSGKVVLVAS
ncbi:MAG: carboxypeptidase-like regulatory domain-containing protein, partial [Dysgonamonadaceae bacterium]|nr:carboxypeptidase-like regulatory domain-containing protein [Dysgonamonadaceae bacterium]